MIEVAVLPRIARQAAARGVDFAIQTEVVTKASLAAEIEQECCRAALAHFLGRPHAWKRRRTMWYGTNKKRYDSTSNHCAIPKGEAGVSIKVSDVHVPTVAWLLEPVDLLHWRVLGWRHITLEDAAKHDKEIPLPLDGFQPPEDERWKLL